MFNIKQDTKLAIGALIEYTALILTKDPTERRVRLRRWLVENGWLPEGL
jgi:hypothetical protein